MVSNAEIKKTIDAIFYKMSSYRSELWNLNTNRWDWSNGVGLFGLVRAYETVSSEAYLQYIVDWFERNRNKHQFGSVNNVAPTNAVLFLLQKFGDSIYRDICEEYAQWCLKTALRTSNGGLAHVWEGGKEDFKNQLWIDSVFMAGIFMVKYALFSSNTELLEEALKQYQLHTDLLYDADNRLFYHAYHCLEKKCLGEHWGRGNGWIAASLAELFTVLDSQKYNLSGFVQLFKDFMERAYSLKEDDGMLHTLLLHKDTYVETTATSLFGYAALRGYKLGLLDKKFEDWGRQIISTVTGFISGDGKIEHCSYGTDPETKEVYATRQCDQSLYADGIVMMLLSEGIGSK